MMGSHIYGVDWGRELAERLNKMSQEVVIKHKARIKIKEKDISHESWYCEHYDCGDSATREYTIKIRIGKFRTSHETWRCKKHRIRTKGL